MDTDSKQFETFRRLKGRNILFADFSEEDLASVMQMSRRENYQAGDTILREGTGGSTMYVLVQGRVSVRKMAGVREVEIKQISGCECFGEMAVISQCRVRLQWSQCGQRRSLRSPVRCSARQVMFCV